MATTTDDSTPVIKIKALYFDIYATLIDWESNLFPLLLPLVQSKEEGSPWRGERYLLAAYAKEWKEVQKKWNFMPFHHVLSSAYRNLAMTLEVPCKNEDAEAIGRVLGASSAFPGTVEALRDLRKHYKLIAFSTVDEKTLRSTMGSTFLFVHFDKIYQAEKNHFNPLHPINWEEDIVKSFGIEAQEMLIVTNSLDMFEKVLPSGWLLHDKLARPGVWTLKAESGFWNDGNYKKVFAGEVKVTGKYASLGRLAAKTKLNCGYIDGYATPAV